MSTVGENNQETPLRKYALLLKAAREYSGLTQKEVAELLAVSKITVSYWETARYLPSKENQQKLIRIYAGFIDDHHQIETFNNMTKKELINTLCEIMEEQ